MSIKEYNVNLYGTSDIWKDFNNCVFIDPGFNAGITYMKILKFNVRLSIYSVNIVNSYRGYDYPDEIRYTTYFNTLREIFDPIHIKCVYCEDVFFRQGSKRSIGAIRSQDLFKTARLIGLTIAAATVNQSAISLLHAHTWKGQLTDEIVRQRVTNRLKNFITNDTWLEDILVNSHICSSLGILLHFVNLLNIKG